jgi:ABC-type transport system substrate-binding protein
MKKRLTILTFAVTMISMLLVPVHAWSYGDPAKPDDALYEEFGPRADRLLISLYASGLSELESGLETGHLDVTDCSLDEAHYNKYMSPPWNATIKVIGYGAEFDLYLFDLNNNNNQYLGNPPNPACPNPVQYLGNPQDPAYPNPVYPNPMSELSMRKAVAYLTNRPKTVSNIGPLMIIPVYTPVGPVYGKYSHQDIKPGGAREDLCYLYNPAAAAAVLDAGHFPVGPDGWRYWDKNGNGVKDADEDFTLKIISRVDSPARDFAGTDLYNELITLKVHCNLFHMSSIAARVQVMDQKNFHIYTGGWSLSVDPDFLVNWNWDYYWHPGRPNNYAGCNNANFNQASNGVMYANDQAEAVYWALQAQIAFAENVLSVPIYTSQGYKAVSRTYVGPEAGYAGQYWNGIVVTPGYGSDNQFSFMNMHPEGYELGNDSSMTIRCGFSTQEILSFNPIYENGVYEWRLLDLIYDPLVKRNPYNLGEFKPWLARSFQVGTYLHPVYGTCTKIKVRLLPNVRWVDGVPLTTADVYFTLVEAASLLTSRGLPPPSWIGNVRDILSLRILDPYTFEVLYKVKSVFALSLLSNQIILPMHVWKPICATGDPTTFAPDPDLRGSGTMRLKENVPNDHVEMVSNKPDKTVKTNLQDSAPVTSPKGDEKKNAVQISGGITVEGQEKDNKISPIPGGQADLKVTTSIKAQINSLELTGGFVVKKQDGSVETGGSFSGTYAPSSNTVIKGSVTLEPGKKTFNVGLDFRFSPVGGIENYTELYYFTIPEDIAGSTYYDDIGNATYPYKYALPSPDIKVDIQDLARASAAFGSYPGHSKWNTLADITGDYKIDIQDLARISAKFGWHG